MSEITSSVVEVANGPLTLVGDHWVPEGPPRGSVLLLHGMAQRRFSWRRTGERLAHQGWSSYAFDARGHGDSGWAQDGDYSIDAMVGDLHAITATFDHAPVLVGASMGGITSLTAVGEGMQVARGLVLVDIVVHIEQDGGKRIMDFVNSAPEGFASLEEAADAIAAYNPHRARPSNLEGLKKNLRQRENGRWYWHWDPALLETVGRSRADQPERLTEAARAIRIPTLLVRGGSSDMVSEKGLREMVELIPHAETAEVAKTGHMIAGDDNDVFTARLGGFLDRLPDEG